MVEEISDARFRKVKVLQGRAKELADGQHLKDNDLVIVRTKIGSLPRYEIEKVDGDPLQFLFKSKR